MQSNTKVSATTPVRNHTAYCLTSPLCHGRMLSPASLAPHAMKSNVPSTTWRSNQAIGVEMKRKMILWVTN